MTISKESVSLRYIIASEVNPIVFIMLLALGSRSKFALTRLISSQNNNTLWLSGARLLTSSKHPPRRNKANDRPRETEAEQLTGEKGKSTRKQSTSRHNRFKSNRRKEWKKKTSQSRGLNPIQNSAYFFDTKSHRLADDNDTFSSPHVALPILNASALLDPLAYCKESAKTAQTHGVTASISGTDAARRLLRGKRDFLVSARDLNSPALLEGHGVPEKLFQHCIDMADAFLRHYGADVVECTFHNYYPASKLPQVIRSRTQSGTNRCTPWPPPDVQAMDWNHHLTLYLTVMERLASHLGMVFQRKLISPSFPSESDDITSSPLLFPDSPSKHHWNVDVLRGSYFEFYNKDGSHCNIAPHPVVEFTHDSKSTGHVLIRLQGHASLNDEFSPNHSSQPVTLVFDACFRRQH